MSHITFSVSHINDLYAWKIAYPHIIKNSGAEKFVVVVPNRQYRAYRRNTSSIYEIISEADFFPCLSKRELATKLLPIHARRAGWYYQQFLKLKAFEYFNTEDRLTLIEGDSFPTASFEVTRWPIYMMAEEFHAPYFATLKNLLGIERTAQKSFISQIFPITVEQGRHFLEEVSKSHGCVWYEAIIRNLDPSHTLAFSEYESLGNFLLHHDYDVQFSNKKFLRQGGLYLSSIKNRDERYEKLILEYALIAIEKADTSSFFKRLSRKLIRLIYG